MSGALSVVIPTWQEVARVAALVARVRALGADEVIVADGGSPDGTAAAAREAGARVISGARGRGAQLRAGVEAARGEVVWMLHADAWPPEGAVEAIRAALCDPQVVGGAFYLHTCEDGPARWGRGVRVADLRSRYTGAPYGDQGIFARAAALAEIGGVPAQPLMEDLELSLRLRRIGRLVTLPLEVRVSARRFVAQPLRAFVTMWTFPLLYRMGVAPERLARWYGRGR